MGYSDGFDLFPPVQPNEFDKWKSFLDDVRSTYIFDPLYRENDKKIYFIGGECEILFDSAKFRSFRSRTSGSSKPIFKYICGIAEIATKYFGQSRVWIWDNCDNEIYSQEEIDCPKNNVLYANPFYTDIKSIMEILDSIYNTAITHKSEIFSEHKSETFSTRNVCNSIAIIKNELNSILDMVPQ